MNYIKFNPFLPLQEGVDELINGILNSSIGDFLGSDFANGMPKSNVLNNEKEFVIEVAVPGMAKESLHIDLEKDKLTVWASQEAADESESQEFTRREFAYQKFRRTFNLPSEINHEAITAQYENGIVRIVLPKAIRDTADSNRTIEIL